MAAQDLPAFPQVCEGIVAKQRQSTSGWRKLSLTGAGGWRLGKKTFPGRLKVLEGMAPSKCHSCFPAKGEYRARAALRHGPVSLSTSCG